MTSRHAAALALVGWYRMTPPLVHREPDETAALSGWSIGRAFDTAKECEDYRSWSQERTKSEMPNGGVHPVNTKQRFAEGILLSQCVASDDPRLKENK
jgi:hypothetical protein